MAEHAPTRRSSRRQTADSALSADIETSPVVAPADVPAAPLSRRALRASRSAAVEPAERSPEPEADTAAESLIAEVAATVVAATEVIVEAVAEPAASPRRMRRSSRPAPSPADSTHVASTAVDAAAVTAQADATAQATTDCEDADAFAAASRALCFSEAPVTAPVTVSRPDEQRASLPTATVHVPARRRGARRKFAAAGATVGIVGIAGMLAVSMTLPAEAVAAWQGGQTTAGMSLVAGAKESGGSDSDAEIQAFVASSDLPENVIQRAEGFSAASLIDLATQQGINYSNTVYTNDPDAAIQWPFIVGVAMSYGFGMRDGRLHEGLDLLPGEGAPVQAIADGKVRIATESGGNYGVTVYIDHMIDGELVTSHYSHMQYGSLQVESGDTVKVGDIVGKVGNTGRSYGAHMHFELIVGGSTIDPMAWFTENAGRYDGVAPVS